MDRLHGTIVGRSLEYRIRMETQKNMNIDDSEVANKARTNQPLFLKANYKSANINAGLLFSLSKAGRAVLAYVIDKMDIAKGDVIFPKVDILNYISNNADLGATTTTVNRGIKDLIDNGVFIQDEHIDSLYHINKDLVWQ